MIIEMVDEKKVVVIVLEVEGIMYVVGDVFLILVVIVGKNRGLVEKLNVVDLVDDDDKRFEVEGKIVSEVPKG